jgi:hypothetical protein
MVAMWWLMACGDEEEVPRDIGKGYADACLGNTAATAPPDLPFVVYEFAGTVEEVEPGITDFTLVPCEPAGATRLMQVRDTNQVAWLLGWVVQGEAAVDKTPTADVAIGAQVEVLFRANDQGKSAGFVVAEIDGGPLVAAMDAGVGTNALGEDEVPGATVWFGDWLTTNEEECGTVHGYEVNFHGDDDLALAPFSEGTLTVRGSSFTATAVSAYEYDAEPACDGVGNQLMWSLFRNAL